MNVAAASQSQSRKASEALGLWEPSRTLTLEAARRHSQRIRLIRRGLLGISALLVLAVIINFATQQGIDILEDNPEESVKMVNPRYSGRTEDGLPFYLTADTATRTLAKRNDVALIKPVLEFIRENGVESSFVEADAGTYDDINKILNLQTDVDLKTDDGYQCATTHARIFAKDKRIEGDEPIACAGNFGTVNGNSYAIEDNYSVFVFKDDMSAVITQDPNRTEDDQDDGLFSFGGDGPINVSAKEAIYKENTTDLNGSVRVEQDGAVITADDMVIIRNTEDDNTDGSLKLGAVRTITAKDNFRYITAENDVVGDQGVYAREKNLITVTGNVRVRQPGGNTVNTDKLEYNVQTETIRFSGQCQGRDCGEDGRVKAVIGGR